MKDAAAIHVVALGGTIAMTSGEGGGATPSLEGPDLVAAVPELAEAANVTAEGFRQLPGASLRLSDIIALRDHLAARSDDGFVITQGTDTLEETSFALDLLSSADVPVVFTGALRNPSLPGADGGANLLNAVRVAASPDARGQGVLVTFGDQIHAARFLRKSHSSMPSAFTSPSLGPLGWVAEDRVRLPFMLRKRLYIEIGDTPTLPRVALVRIGFDDDGTQLEHLSERYDAVVIDGMGAGHVPAWLVDRIATVSSSIPTMLTSRTGSGETLTSTYGFEGSERDLIARAIIVGGVLDGLKARIFLTLALAAGWTRDEIAVAAQTMAG